MTDLLDRTRQIFISIADEQSRHLERGALFCRCSMHTENLLSLPSEEGISTITATHSQRRHLSR